MADLTIKAPSDGATVKPSFQTTGTQDGQILSTTAKLFDGGTPLADGAPITPGQGFQWAFAFTNITPTPKGQQYNLDVTGTTANNERITRTCLVRVAGSSSQDSNK